LARAKALRLLFSLLVLILTVSPTLAQDWDEIQMTTTALGSGIFMIEGGGGNLVLCTGDDGAFLVDDQYAPLNEKIRAAIAEQTQQEVQWVLNTHWHGDHTGGNENFGGTGSFIVAHENVRQRMSRDQFSEIFDRTTPASPPLALPIVTFNDSISFYWNGQTLRAFHVAPAHTDGDAMVHFVEADVLHTGDVFWSEDFPFVDHASGGSLEGMIEALGLVLATIDDDTQVVPGHGSLSNRAGVERSLEMLLGVRAAIAELLDQGMDVDAVVEADPTAPWNEEWGNGWLNPEQFTRITTTGMMLQRADD
jgi:glyoxylase-like metal-dependent hydrolase (beta-lactamase superfamily II)